MREMVWRLTDISARTRHIVNGSVSPLLSNKVLSCRGGWSFRYGRTSGDHQIKRWPYQNGTSLVAGKVYFWLVDVQVSLLDFSTLILFHFRHLQTSMRYFWMQYLRRSNNLKGLRWAIDLLFWSRSLGHDEHHLSEPRRMIYENIWHKVRYRLSSLN